MAKPDIWAKVRLRTGHFKNWMMLEGVISAVGGEGGGFVKR